MLLIICAAVVLSACGAPASESAAPPMAATPASPQAPASPAPGGAAQSPAGSAAAPSVPAAPAPPLSEDFEAALTYGGTDYLQIPVLTHEQTGRLLVYRVEMRLQTTEFMPGVRLLLDTTVRLSGYPTLFEVHGRDLRNQHLTERSADFSIRIPTAQLGEFIAIVEDNYNIWRLTQVAEDETDTYRGADNTIAALMEEEILLERELQILTEGEYRAPVVARLAEVRRQIRQAQLRQQAIMDNVIYSTVTIQLFEVIPPELKEEIEEPTPPTFGERVSAALTTSRDTVITLAQGTVLFVIRAMPVILVLAVIALITFIAFRIGDRHITKKNSSPTQNIKPAEPASTKNEDES